MNDGVDNYCATKGVIKVEGNSDRRKPQIVPGEFPSRRMHAQWLLADKIIEADINKVQGTGSSYSRLLLTLSSLYWTVPGALPWPPRGNTRLKYRNTVASASPTTDDSKSLGSLCSRRRTG